LIRLSQCVGIAVQSETSGVFVPGADGRGDEPGPVGTVAGNAREAKLTWPSVASATTSNNGPPTGPKQRRPKICADTARRLLTKSLDFSGRVTDDDAFILRGKIVLMRLSIVVSLLAVVLTSTGCQDGPKPRARLGTYPTSTLGSKFSNPEALGRHGYRFSLSEKNGIVYTCRGGHIDLAHLRIAADWTAYLTGKSYRHLMDGDTQFSYKLAVDRSRHYVELSYPPDWAQRSQPERAAVAEEIAAALGPRLAFNLTTWHEILTWFGFKCVGLPTAFSSAFSWEDSFSNLLGTHLAARALRDTERSFNKAMTAVLADELGKLGTVSVDVAKRATSEVKGDWFTGSSLFFVDIMERNFDIGLADGMVTATLLPDIAECEGAVPASYPAPALDVLAQHGFSAKLEIEPHEWEKNAILAVAYPDAEQRGKRIEPAVHFAPIMEHIRKDAIRRYGRDSSTHHDVAQGQ